jgi:hypothetical protein
MKFETTTGPEELDLPVSEHEERRGVAGRSARGMV